MKEISLNSFRWIIVVLIPAAILNYGGYSPSLRRNTSEVKFIEGVFEVESANGCSIAPPPYCGIFEDNLDELMEMEKDPHFNNSGYSIDESITGSCVIGNIF